MSDQAQDAVGALQIPNFTGVLVSLAREECRTLGVGLTVTNPGAAVTGNPEESKIKEHASTTPPGGMIMPGGIISVVIQSGP